MNPLGLVLIVAASLIPLYWYFPLFPQHDNLAVISQYLGSVSLILMGVVQFMATRVRGIEMIFGSMDRIYVLHKWLAITAIVFAALHDTIDADMQGLGNETFLTDLAETLGELGFYGILVLGIITLITFVPYHYWKWSHSFIGFFFALSAIHFAFILKPFSNTDPLGIYVLGFCVLGILSYLYLLLPKDWTSHRAGYQVNQVEHLGESCEISLSPTGRGIKHKAGQFAFISFDNKDKQEPHPFTISSAPNDQGDIRFTIKKLGDYTADLAQSIKAGDKAKLSPAYGHFTHPKHTSPQIWIAAGIGITPFMAWAQTLDSQQTTPVKLYYCVASEDQALYLNELQNIANTIDSFELELVVSGTDPRLSAEQIKQNYSGSVSDSQVYFCGPKAMRESLKSGLTTHGLNRSAFHFEEFEIRSGVGIRKFIGWLLRRYGAN